MAFTEFACRSGGSNLNAGTRIGNSTVPGVTSDLTYASGSWVSSTGVFTPASGDPIANGVAVGDFASVYADAATVTTLVGRVTARTTTTITVSTTAKSGTTTDGSLTRTLKIGGAWLGPNGASGFPMNFVTSACTNSGADSPRINYKNDATYSITANISSITGVSHFGFSSVYADRSRAILDGGTTGASYSLIGPTGGNIIADFIFQNNGATGTTAGAFLNTFVAVLRCVANSFRGNGFQSNGTVIYSECEAYGCNQSNTGGTAGWVLNGPAMLTNCIAHDNTGSNASGFICAQGGYIVNCISESNGADGIRTSAMTRLINCDLYNNGGDGIEITSGVGVIIENCNFIKNTGASIRGFGVTTFGQISNCGYGAGTQANGLGNTTIGSMEETGAVTYGSNLTPWVDPANGDFRISLAAAKGTGRGAYTQTAASYAGTVGYPDIGSAQHIDSGGGGINVAHGMHGGMR